MKLPVSDDHIAASKGGASNNGAPPIDFIDFICQQQQVDRDAAARLVSAHVLDIYRRAGAEPAGAAAPSDDEPLFLGSLMPR